MASSESPKDPGPPVDEPASSTGDVRSRKGRRPSATRKARLERKPGGTRTKSLIDTTGPEPNASLEGIKLTIGVIGGTHGVQGELKLKLLTDHPEHLPTIRQVYLGDSDTPTKLVGVRMQGDQALIQLEGVTSPEAGKLLGGLKVRIAGSDALPLEEGEYFLYQLIGLAAVTGDGQPIGTVTDILETGAHDVLTIRPENGPDILVPNHPRFVLDVAPERNVIVIDPPVYDS